MITVAAAIVTAAGCCLEASWWFQPRPGQTFCWHMFTLDCIWSMCVYSAALRLCVCVCMCVCVCLFVCFCVCWPNSFKSHHSEILTERVNITHTHANTHTHMHTHTHTQAHTHTHTHTHTSALCLHFSDNSITRNKTLEMLCWKVLSTTRIGAHKSQARNNTAAGDKGFLLIKYFSSTLFQSDAAANQNVWAAQNIWHYLERPEYDLHNPTWTNALQ